MKYICKFHRIILKNSLFYGKFKFPCQLFVRTNFRYSVNVEENAKSRLFENSMQNQLTCRKISTSSICLFWNKDPNPPHLQITVRNELFENTKEREKKDFLIALEMFKESTTRRGHVEFVYTAMKHMEEYGVEGDLETYKSIMDVFPKGKMVAENRIQVEFLHFPRHQYCAIDLLEKMEENGVCPDLEMREIIINTFGSLSHVFRKFARMLYWMPKFKHLSPFPLPETMPRDTLELSKLAVERMCPDLQNVVTIYNCEDLKDSLDKTWIVSGQSPTQQRLIKEHSLKEALFVEGPFFIWLKTENISYFLLRAEPKIKPNLEEKDIDDVSNLESNILNPFKLKPSLLDRIPSIHEQEDGIVLGLCATGTSSSDSLLSWIRFLQISNPKLIDIPILFKLRSPATEIATTMDNQFFTKQIQEKK